MYLFAGSCLVSRVWSSLFCWPSVSSVRLFLLHKLVLQASSPCDVLFYWLVLRSSCNMLCQYQSPSFLSRICSSIILVWEVSFCFKRSSSPERERLVFLRWLCFLGVNHSTRASLKAFSFVVGCLRRNVRGRYIGTTSRCKAQRISYWYAFCWDASEFMRASHTTTTKD